MTDARPVLYLVVCAAPRATRTPHLVGLLQEAGWDVCVIATPQALGFIGVDDLEQLTGHPVRSTYKRPDEPDVLPPADAMVVCPATFNTMNKWALGIADTLALGLITEAIGTGVKLVAAPSLNNAQEQHPAFARSVRTLRECGVTVLYGPGVYEPTAPGTGGREFEWGLIVEAVGPPPTESSDAGPAEPALDQLIREFERSTRATIQRLMREIKYRPRLFSEMVGNEGAVAAHKTLLRTPRVSDGFMTLKDNGKLADSVEAAVLNPHYERLFTSEERAIARQRLEDIGGFDVDAYLQSL